MTKNFTRTQKKNRAKARSILEGKTSCKRKYLILGGKDYHPVIIFSRNHKMLQKWGNGQIWQEILHGNMQIPAKIVQLRAEWDSAWR